MPRDYLNVYGGPNDSRPLITSFDEKTGRPHVGFDPETGHVVAVVPEAPVVVEEVVEASPAPEAQVEPAAEPVEEAPAEEVKADVEASQ